MGFHKGEADALKEKQVCDLCFGLCVFCDNARYTLSPQLPFFSPPGRSSLFPIDDNLLDDGHGNQGVPGVLGPNCYPHQNGERIERFSRKVFVGGLPPDIDEGEDNNTSFGMSLYCWFLCSLIILRLLLFPQMK